MKHRDPPTSNGPSAPIFVALPARAELHQLLRRASGEAVALVKAKPVPSSWSLTAIATAQAKTGDLDGARITFAEAAKEAEGGFGGNASPRNLWRIGHAQAECGLKEDSRTTLERAVRAVPAVAGEFGKDRSVVDALAEIVQTQVGIGAREDAHKTVELLLEFSKKFFASTNIANARDGCARRLPQPWQPSATLKPRSVGLWGERTVETSLAKSPMLRPRRSTEKPPEDSCKRPRRGSRG